MYRLTLALDWTPNINHIGFFIAKQKKFYSELGLDVKIIDPSTDNYAITPAKKVELGIANFALCPTESIFSYRTKSKPFDLTAIAAILQYDLSAIAVKKDGKIKSPKDLDGKIYASYNARYEEAIVKQMIRNNGGTGEIITKCPEKLGIWETVVKNSFDATWIFLNWEGIEATNKKIPLHYFKMRDYNIPYAYSPVIAASQTLAKTNAIAYRKFLEATKKGYLFCKKYPNESVAILKRYIPESDKHINLRMALNVSIDAFGTEETWGRMNLTQVKVFLNWLYEQKLESKHLTVEELMTNVLIP